MVENQDSGLILSTFLIKAWDTVATIEEGARRLAVGEPVSSGVLDPLVVTARDAGHEPTEARP